MGTIGGLTFVRIEGPQVPAQARTITPINRPGVDGEALRENAKKVKGITLTTIEWVTNLAACNNAQDTYDALKGTTVTVVDDLGRAVNNVMVVDVVVVQCNQILISSPSGYTHQVRAVWTLKPTG